MPVSSSGHLVLFQKLLGVEVHSIEFDVAAHLGTLASIFTVYRSFIAKTVKQTFSKPYSLNADNKLLLRLVIFASVPTGVIGLLLKDYFEAMFSNLSGVAVCLSITGAILMFSKWRSPDQDQADFLNFSVDDLKPLTWRIAILIGFAQAFAIAPGISRSGMTIASGMLLGLPQSVAALFSFMISIPAILGAGLLQLKDLDQFEPSMLINLAVGFAVAYVSGVVGLKLVLHYVKKGRLHLFSYYLWLVAAAILSWSALS
ncbi:MAG: undecaprenyl-diphosphate phosphatase [Bdellovibrionales bacterium]|nr:undecaprenyl-diphosphate phosphatase [Bdellovibrionales bacterium]